MNMTKEQNKKLIEKYPFLLPHNRWTDEVSEDYDYSYTELDAMPDGWRIAFGEQMCEEIRQELEQVGYLDKYRISQIKEKYGSLRWYDFGCTEKMSREIIPKYEKISAYTCIRCGKPATRITTGWFCPFCDDCVPKNGNGEHYKSVPIEEYYKKCTDESEN